MRVDTTLYRVLCTSDNSLVVLCGSLILLESSHSGIQAPLIVTPLSVRGIELWLPNSKSTNYH